MCCEEQWTDSVHGQVRTLVPPFLRNSFFAGHVCNHVLAVRHPRTSHVGQQKNTTYMSGASPPTSRTLLVGRHHVNPEVGGYGLPRHLLRIPKKDDTTRNELRFEEVQTQTRLILGSGASSARGTLKMSRELWSRQRSVGRGQPRARSRSAKIARKRPRS